MSTEVVPVAPEPQPAPVDEAIVAPPRRKRRGWIVALVVIGILVVLAIVAFVVAEGIAKDYARDYVRARIVQVLQLPEDAEVEVDIGRGSIILQALAGRLDAVDVSVPEVSFGALVGAAELHAEGVPLDETVPVEVLRVEIAVAERDVSALAGNLSGLELSSIELDGAEIVIASAFSLFGLEIPIGMGILPSAQEGDLVFSPTRITLGDQEYTADEIRANPFFALLAGPLLAQQSVCIADQLPSAFVLNEVAVTRDRLVLGIRGDGAALGGPGLSTLGVCAG